MRVPALAILIALAPTLAATGAAADEAFRARLSEVIAEQGGCAESRALVEGELAAFERARKGEETADEPAPLLLFGKPAADWTGENIRDLVAVIRACEAARPGQSRNAEERERRLTERMDRLAQAMRRAVVLSRRPPEIEETSANPTLRADALPEAAGGGRPRAGPAAAARAPPSCRWTAPARRRNRRRASGAPRRARPRARRRPFRHRRSPPRPDRLRRRPPRRRAERLLRTPFRTLHGPPSRRGRRFRPNRPSAPARRPRRLRRPGPAS